MLLPSPCTLIESSAPQPGFAGSDGFSFTISDGAAESTGWVTLVVLAPAPTAVADHYSVLHDTSGGGNLLANDSDPSGNSLTVVGYTQTPHGNLVVAPSGSFTYTPLPGFVGTDSFTYTISNGATQASATVTIDVRDARPYAATHTYTVQHDHTLLAGHYGDAAPSLLAAATDTDELDLDKLHVVAYSQAAHGSLWVDPDGSFVYTPLPGFQGPDQFTYTLSDGADTASATVTLHVADQAPAAEAATYTLLHDQTLDAGPSSASPGLLTLASDLDNANGTTVDTLQVVSYSEPSFGTLIVQPDGSFTYTPQGGFVGADTFSYTVSDGAETTTGTITLDVSNQAPLAQDTTYSVLHDQTLVADDNAAPSLLAFVTDANHEPVFFLVTTEPAHGSLD